MNRFQNIDWDRLYKLLRVVAAGIVRRARIGDAIDSFSAEDLVTETMDTFFTSSNGLGWNDKKGSMEALRRGVLKKKAIDRLRRQKHVAGSPDDASGKVAQAGKPRAVAPERARADCCWRRESRGCMSVKLVQEICRRMPQSRAQGRENGSAACATTDPAPTRPNLPFHRGRIARL